jgi:2-polyprenyl-3-methyl-5-hydroxy-6-metoxy-1,4-benzoquinol methylase
LRSYYEELWQRLPARLQPPDFAARRAFLVERVRPGDRVLDLGCGEGAFLGVIADAGATAVGADVADAALERARAAHPEADLELVPYEGPLPFEDSSFDVVWASEVIEHVADTGGFLSEVRRVLRTDGLLLLTTPGHGRLRALLAGVPDPLGDHLRFFTAGSLARTLRAFGLDPVRVGPLTRRAPWRAVTLAAAARRLGWSRV